MAPRQRWASLTDLMRHAIRQQEWMSLREAAELYRVTDETMLTWVRAGAFTTQNCDGRTWVARADLEAALRRKPEHEEDGDEQ